MNLPLIGAATLDARKGESGPNNKIDFTDLFNIIYPYDEIIFHLHQLTSQQAHVMSMSCHVMPHIEGGVMDGRPGGTNISRCFSLRSISIVRDVQVYG